MSFRGTIYLLELLNKVDILGKKQIAIDTRICEHLAENDEEIYQKDDVFIINNENGITFKDLLECFIKIEKRISTATETGRNYR